MSRGHYRRFALWSALLFALGLTSSGCALFSKPPGELITRTFKLPTIGVPPDAIQLDVIYVERPLGDALLGDELWRYTSEISIETEQRSTLRRNGFRAGVVGSNPPPALQRMLGLKHDFAYEPQAEKSKQLRGHRYMLRSGNHQTILASQVYPECSLDIPQGDRSQHHSFDNAQCKYRVTAERLQDGWVQLDFVPQIHHGPQIVRPVVGEDGWQYQDGQKTATLFPQRFTVRLAVGDMAIITAADDSQGRLGELFFRGPSALTPPTADGQIDGANSADALNGVQRLLVVRLAAMGNTNGPHAAAAR